MNDILGITEAMRNEGSEMAKILISVQIEIGLGGLGGCSQFDVTAFPERFRDLILLFIDSNEEFDSVSAIFVAMDRVRESGAA